MSAPTISGFMVLRNGAALGYPFVEAIVSALPVCDEFLVSDGYSTDHTFAVLQKLQAIFPDKIKLFQDQWTTAPDDGRVIANVSNQLRARCDGDYCLYVQGNEILHESSADEIRCLPDLYPTMELFSLPYLSYMGPRTIAFFEYRRRLFVNRPRIEIQGDGYDVGYDKGRLLRSPLRFASYVLQSTGERRCPLSEPVYRYRGIFPASFVKKIAQRGAQYSTPGLAQDASDELRRAEAALEKTRRPGQSPDDFWNQMAGGLTEPFAPQPGAGPVPAGGKHPSVMTGSFDPWHYDPWASLERIAP